VIAVLLAVPLLGGPVLAASAVAVVLAVVVTA
jgi:hypothetical protein